MSFMSICSIYETIVVVVTITIIIIILLIIIIILVISNIIDTVVTMTPTSFYFPFNSTSSLASLIYFSLQQINNTFTISIYITGIKPGKQTF